MASRLPLLLFVVFFLPLCSAASASAAMVTKTIEISEAWIADAPPTASVYAAYAHIKNSGERDRVLVDVTSPKFEKVEIHNTINQDGVISMRRETQLRIPARGSLILTPGKRHMMLINPATPLKLHDTVVLLFIFADGTQQAVTTKITRRSKH